jgi:hypothetical protein
MRKNLQTTDAKEQTKENTFSAFCHKNKRLNYKITQIFHGIALPE